MIADLAYFMQLSNSNQRPISLGLLSGTVFSLLFHDYQ